MTNRTLWEEMRSGHRLGRSPRVHLTYTESYHVWWVALLACSGLDRYDPDFSPENFVDPDAIGAGLTPNPYVPLSPEAQEHKYFAPGIGLILEVDLVEGSRLELIEFSSR